VARVDDPLDLAAAFGDVLLLRAEHRQRARELLVTA